MYTTFVTDYLSQEHGHRWLTLSFRVNSRKLNDVGYLPLTAITDSSPDIQFQLDNIY